MERRIKYGSGLDGSTPVQNQQLNQWGTKCLGLIEEGNPSEQSRFYTYQLMENKSDAAASNSTGEGATRRRRWRSESCAGLLTGLAGPSLPRRPCSAAAATASAPRYGWSGRVRRVGVSVSGT